MAYKRRLAEDPWPQGDLLTRDLIGLGFQLTGSGSINPPIERTLVAASLEGLQKPDYRVLSLLCQWLETHAGRINVDLLTRLTHGLKQSSVRAYWAAVGQWLGKDRRFLRLATLYRGPRISLPQSGASFQISRHGEDPRFAQTCFRVPSNLLRRRPADVASPSGLAKTHSHYHHRVILGPGYRADLWAELEKEPNQAVATLARKVSASFASAWQVKQCHRILQPPSPK